MAHVGCRSARPTTSPPSRNPDDPPFSRARSAFRDHVLKEDTMFDLSGKTALVTGATGGIGGAIARALHERGAIVAVSGTRREVLEGLAQELGDRVHVLPCNLADKDDVETLVPRAEEAMQ